AAAGFDDRRVAGAQANLVDRQLELIGGDLGKGGFVALATRLRAGDDFDGSFRNAQLDALARRPDWRFDIVCDADAAGATRLALALGEAGIVGDLERALHVAWEIARFEDEAHRRAVRQVGLSHQVASPDLGPIHPQLARREVQQPLDDVMRFGPTGAAVRHRRHRVARGTLDA